MGRTERPIDPGNQSLEATFGRELRAYRTAAHTPTYAAMSQRAHLSSTALSKAAIGNRLPTRDVAVRYVKSLYPPDDPHAIQLAAAVGQRRDKVCEAIQIRDHTETTRPLEEAAAPEREAPGDRLVSSIRLGARRRAAGWAQRRLPTVAASVLVAVSFTGTTAYAVQQRDAGGPPRTVSGTVTCERGARVTGVWIETDREPSGFAKLQILDANSAHYSHRVKTSRPWTVHVGCGGTPLNWDSDNVGDAYTTNGYQDWVCFEPTPQQPSYRGCEPR